MLMTTRRTLLVIMRLRGVVSSVRAKDLAHRFRVWPAPQMGKESEMGLNKVHIINLGVIHRIFNCGDCKWYCDDFNNGSRLARNHAKRMKHRVTGDVAKSVIYDWNP